MDLHVYKNGYSTLPQLEKLEGSPFHFDFNYDYYIEEKRKAVRSGQKVHLLHNCDHKILFGLEDFIKQHAEWVNPPYTLQNIAMQVQEDMAIHRVKDGRDWLAATHICFPSSWRPEQKVGRPLAEIHSPIPDMNLENSYKIAEACTKSGPFRRWVWTPVFEENKINYHPSLPKKKFDIKNPNIYVKVEKQITWPLPEFNAFIFILRQYIVRPEIEYLYEACNDMNEKQRQYKGVTKEFLEYMENLNVKN